MSEYERKAERARARLASKTITILDAFSKSTKKISGHDENDDSERKTGLSAEIAAFSLLSQCGLASYGLVPDIVSDNFPRPSDDGFETPKITLAGIGLQRDDIGLPAERKMLEFHETNKGSITRVSSSRTEDQKFDYKAWEKSRLDALRIAVTEDPKASIISFGEFDYPPLTQNDYADEFDEKVLTLIDSVTDRCVMVVGGSRHELDNGSCVNRARIFTNAYMNTFDGPPKPRPVLRDKFISDTSLGEVLAPTADATFKYFDTALGNVFVFICIEANNPSVFFSLLNTKSKRGPDATHRPDFVVVPAYNTNPKLYYSCQVLSMFCGCPVLFVDACSVTKSEVLKQPSNVELFLYGHSIKHLESAFEDGEIEIREEPLDEGEIRYWTYSANVIRQLELCSIGDTPFLNDVSALTDTVND